MSAPDPAELRHAARAASDRLSDLREALEAVRGRASGDAGDVHVVCDGAGTPVEMTLEPAAMRRSPASLADEIVEVCDRAARDAFVAHSTLVSDFGAPQVNNRRQVDENPLTE